MRHISIPYTLLQSIIQLAAVQKLAIDVGMEMFPQRVTVLLDSFIYIHRLISYFMRTQSHQIHYSLGFDAEEHEWSEFHIETVLGFGQLTESTKERTESQSTPSQMAKSISSRFSKISSKVGRSVLRGLQHD